MFDKKKLIEIVRSFSKLRVIVVGDLVLDEYLFGKSSRISREAPVPIVDLEGAEVRPGGAANTCANVSAMGAKVTAVGVVGADRSGELLKKVLRQQGINDKSVYSVKTRATTTKTRVLAGDIHTTRQQLLRIDRGERNPLPFSVSKKIADKLVKLAETHDAVALSDYGFGILSEHVLKALVEIAKSKPVVADSRFDLMKLEKVTVVTPNEPETEQALNMKLKGEGEVVSAGKTLLRKLGCEMALITRGNKGMALIQRGKKPFFLPIAQNKEAVDVTGAGDTVVSAFTLALAAKATAEESAFIANHSASVAVSRSGAVAVSWEEIIASIELSQDSNPR